MAREVQSWSRLGSQRECKGASVCATSQKEGLHVRCPGLLDTENLPDQVTEILTTENQS